MGLPNLPYISNVRILISVQTSSSLARSKNPLQPSPGLYIIAMRVVSILLVSGLALLYCQVAALPHPQEDEEEVEDETEEKEENDVGELNLDSENFNDVGKLNLCTFVETIY